MKEKDNILPESFKDRIIFMSIYNDIDWDRKGNEESCERNSSSVAKYARKFPKGHWSFLGPGSEEKWYATLAHKLDGSWNRVAEQMMIAFAESGHPVFRRSSALSRGPPKSKGGGRTSTHYNAELATAGLLLLSVNQLSIFRDIADWCQDLAQQIAAQSPSSTENPAANVNNDPASQVPSADVSNLTKSPMFSAGAR